MSFDGLRLGIGSHFVFLLLCLMATATRDLAFLVSLHIKHVDAHASGHQSHEDDNSVRGVSKENRAEGNLGHRTSFGFLFRFLGVIFTVQSAFLIDRVLVRCIMDGFEELACTKGLPRHSHGYTDFADHDSIPGGFLPSATISKHDSSAGEIPVLIA